MINLIRTNSVNPDFIKLVKLLDEELAIVDREDHSFYSQFNKIDNIRYVVVAYEDKNLPGVEQLKNMILILWKSNECLFPLKEEKKGSHQQF